MPSTISISLASAPAFEQRAAHAVDAAALVHHVVVFEDVFARREVLRFDSLLRRRDSLRDQAAFDRHIFSMPSRNIRFCMRCRRRYASGRLAGIGRTARYPDALASGAPTELVIDTP